jgi:hypothetical protein
MFLSAGCDLVKDTTVFLRTSQEELHTQFCVILNLYHPYISQLWQHMQRFSRPHQALPNISHTINPLTMKFKSSRETYIQPIKVSESVFIL